MNVDEWPLQKLLDASNRHRLDHGDGCNVYPSQNAVLCGTVAAALPATRVLEVGCGIGYLAACIASYAPHCRIETIESDPSHVRLALAEFERLGYEAKITVLSGDAEAVLPELSTPYDMVIEDAGLEYPRWLPELTRLTRPRGVLVTRNLAGSSLAWEEFLPTDATTIVRSQPTV